MLRFVATRLAGLVVVLWLLATTVFLIGAYVPSDPARAFAGAGADPEVIAAKRAELELDEPVPTSYAHYLQRLARGDLSESIHTRQPVRDDLRSALPATLELLVAAVALTALLGVLVGLVGAGASRGSRGARLALTAGASVPSFLLALVLLLVGYSALGVLPPGGRLSADLAEVDGPTGFLTADALLAGRPVAFFDALWHLVLPALCLALTPALLIARVLRSSLLLALRQDYARTARAKGVPERSVLLHHALRNALNAPLTIAGLSFGAMLATIAVVEAVFSWPGVGLYIDQAIVASDFPAIAGVTLVVGLVYVVVNALVDVAQAVADPRLRTQ